MNPFLTLTSRLLPLPLRDVDTDQIIPARYLKITDRSGLAEGLFASWRYQADGSPQMDFVLNRPERQGAHILLAGDNFGCGSSREHAPWALLDNGIRAVISTSFADIFRNNALKNGLLPVSVEPDLHAALFELAERDPAAEVTVDLEACQLRLPGRPPAPFPIDAFSRTCLLHGVDEIGYVLGFEEQIRAYEQKRASTLST